MEKSKHDVMCVNRGDIEYLKQIAAMLLNGGKQATSENENIAKALLGISNAAYPLSSDIDIS